MIHFFCSNMLFSLYVLAFRVDSAYKWPTGWTWWSSIFVLVVFLYFDLKRVRSRTNILGVSPWIFGAFDLLQKHMYIKSCSFLFLGQKILCPRVTVMFHPCFLVDFWINKANVTFPILVILGLTQENMQWLKDLPRVFGGKTWMRLRSRELPHYRYKIVIKQHSVHHMKSHVTRIVVGHKHVQ